ncbi:MAG TPA: dihydrolipoamide acetyltransferase family protein [Candidatus Limnocylindrales bacterium]|nr:dihydrolipoamide acetyltransferase family protein [Candidatus Limnocylindrales bacterium]HZM10716.1 dihydrolipoamide acetyltransferase family protein [Candidatus Limnocylindrales bacterium]
MPTDVIMPQMGESIFEGTITKWLKQPGEKVQRDEPLFEISTDKVDAEIPAPASGTLQEIKVQAGATVQVNTVVGTIAGEGEAAGAAPSAPAAGTAPPAAPSAPAATTAPPATAGGDGSRSTQTEAAQPPSGEEPKKPSASQTGKESAQPAQEKTGVEPAQQGAVLEYPEAGEQDRVRSSPLVRRIAKDNKVDMAQVPGTGLGGRITKEDIESFIAKHGAGGPQPAAPAQPAAVAAPSAAAPSIPATVAPLQPVGGVTPGEVVPMSVMRKKIAEHMVLSKRTSAHVHGVFEVDVTRIVKLREKMKTNFEQATGNKLTFTPFFARAVVHGIRQWPIINSSVEGENIHYHASINLGIAVALDWGLIVPVVKNAEERSFVGLQRAITDLGERARTKKLKPDEVQGGTFTITNPGIFGAKFGMPIINQPQVAIMGVGGIMKKPVVVTDKDGNDSIAIRSMMHLSIGYDHRIVDGAVADQFMAEVKQFLENWNEELL